MRLEIRKQEQIEQEVENRPFWVASRLSCGLIVQRPSSDSSTREEDAFRKCFAKRREHVDIRQAKERKRKKKTHTGYP